MATETELKLLIEPAAMERLSRHSLLCHATGQAARLLHNTYYDTAALDLARAKVALRVRRQGERFIQTLKTRGQSIDGLHQRGEWEWDLASEQLDPALLEADIWPAELIAPDQLALIPVFTTDFTRRLWWLTFEGAEIEVALDLGEVVCDCGDGRHLTDPISELELELKSGPADALFALAHRLAEQAELQPGDISKAQRGYRLFSQCSQHSMDCRGDA
ncbi:inorganic triphosphatase YgiF [Marinobacterium sp. MBR-111]|jgi:inorganic triphosphatase YgiF|uniref:CYTH domain-containing protein n=1 Tax=Marinobacterium sp. MBR-111 TaxID=3156463 RepID=UPI003396AEDB